MLFKYLKPDSAVVLKDRTLRFTPISTFNDPLEGLSDTTMLSDPDWRKPILEELHRDSEFADIPLADLERCFNESHHCRSEQFRDVEWGMSVTSFKLAAVL